MFKLDKNYDRKKDLSKGSELVTYGRTFEELEELRQNEMKRIKELLETIENMTIEEYDVYLSTVLSFENNLCDASDSGMLDNTERLVGERYGKNSTIYYMTTISNYSEE